MEGFDIFIMVLAFFAMIVITVSKNKKQRDRKTGHPAGPIPTPTSSYPERGGSPADALEDIKRALAEAERHSSQPELGIEEYVEHEPAGVEPVKVGAGEGVRSTIAVKDEKYSLAKKQNEAAKGIKVEIDPRNLIIYSEIMRPKWEEY